MAARKRSRIPKTVEREVLFRNQSVCCVCRKSGVQIHHIDCDPSNNDISNLCVLCIEHHAEASRKGTMTKNLDSNMLQKYKAEWEGSVASQHYSQMMPITRPSEHERYLINFEIRRSIYSLPSNRDISYANAMFEYVYTWNLLEEDCTQEILDQLGHVNWFLDSAQIEIIARRLYELFWHLVDPHRIPMSDSSERELMSAIALLGYFGTHVIVVKPQIKPLQSVLYGLKSLFEIGVKYDKSALRKEVIRQLVKMKKDLRKEKSAVSAKAILMIEKEVVKMKKVDDECARR
jgi:hypothetical protein